MLGNAVNRCQATPIVVSAAMTMNQAMDTTIFTAATTRIAFPSAVGEESVSPRPSQLVRAKCPPAGWSPEAVASAYSSARSVRMQTAIAATVAST